MLTFNVSALSPGILSPTPHRVEKQGHAHPAAYFESQGVVNIGTIVSPLSRSSQSPHLSQHFSKPFGQVIAGR